MSEPTAKLPSLPRSDRVHRLRERLLAWYERERRDLPWRRIRDPYGIWISEAMLQQTRVATVIEYWQRFLKTLPDVQALATAEEETVLGLWSGLGYYRRARSLHAAAQAIVERHAGQFPRTREEVLALPGVGEYTAGAVLSIAFDQREPVVDGNVERVLTRVFALPGASGSGPLRRYLWRLAQHMLPPEGGAGDWNQALMELGATTCTSRSPACERCPWHRLCAARRGGDVERFPEKKAKRTAQDLPVESLWIVREGQLLLRQRPSSGSMAGLWELPTRRTTDAPESSLWPEHWPAEREFEMGPELWQARHAITHHRITVRVHRSRLRGAVRAPYGWFAWQALDSLALTGLTKKAVAHLASEGEAP